MQLHGQRAVLEGAGCVMHFLPEEEQSGSQAGVLADSAMQVCASRRSPARFPA